jgi:hypothetical protein
MQIFDGKVSDGKVKPGFTVLKGTVFKYPEVTSSLIFPSLATDALQQGKLICRIND